MEIGPGTRVLVTGASRGIGAAVADRLRRARLHGGAGGALGRARGGRRERMPSWYRPGRNAPPEPLAKAIVTGVERESREVFYPPSVRLLRIVHGPRPGLADAVLRRVMDRSAAP